MPTLFVTRRDGSERVVEADANQSVMEIIRDNGFDELLATLRWKSFLRHLSCLR